VRLAPPQNKVLLATAYLTWGAALMGLKDFNQADRVLALAIEANPGSSTALHLRSEERALAGDKDGAAKYAQQAKEETTSFENYAEVAALYFQLSWGTNQPITRNEFSNPGVVTFHSGGVSH
jgi:tetratricopeptide (TPR) repeat protein